MALYGSTALSSDDTDHFQQFMTTVFETTAKVIGFRKTSHKDWFDDQDFEAGRLLDTMYSAHLTWINDKVDSCKKSTYTKARRAAKKRLREMKEEWWSRKATELQVAFDRNDTKAFYDGLKAVYGVRDTGSNPVRSRDGSSLSRTVQAFYLAGLTTFVAFSTKKQHLIRLCSLSYPPGTPIRT